MLRTIRTPLQRYLNLWILLVLLAAGLAGCFLPTSQGSTPTAQTGAPSAQQAESIAVTQAGTDTAAETVADTVAETAADTVQTISTVSDATNAASTGDSVARPVGWSDETHSNQVDPDYAVVFPEDQVNRITITITPETWAAMQENMTELYGERGTGQMGGPDNMPREGGGFGRGRQGAPQDFAPPQGMPVPPNQGEPPAGFEMPTDGGFAGGPRGGMFATEDPIWVTATIEFEGNVWTHVGLRYKGNSTLMTSWRNGSDKLPFRLNFDKFEDDYPEIDNQRFYGFKKLAFSNNVADTSFLREAVAYDLMEAAGLAASQTAFYEVLFDYGEGPVSVGLYTAVEVVDDTVIDGYFGSDDGNIYKPEGQAASLAAGTFDQIAENFQKDNNEKQADWSDIESLYEILHSDLRTSDPAAWQAELEAVFDVDTFLHWLAIGAVIQHWDTYGAMTQNYYLYNNPETGLLTWVSWDLDRTFSGGGTDGPGRMGGVSLGRSETTASWPLIRYLLDMPEYNAQYVGYIEQTRNELFTTQAMTARFETAAALVRPYAASEIGQDAFDRAVQSLLGYVETRGAEVDTFLASQR